MVQLQSKPILEHIINKAIQENFTNIYISTHFKSEIIEEYFGDGSKFNIKISYIKEKKPLGTGGSFKLMSKYKGPIVVTNGDIISKIGEPYFLTLSFSGDFPNSFCLKHLSHRVPTIQNF